MPEILPVANAAIAAERAAVSERTERDPPANSSASRRWSRCNDGSEQAPFVAQRILELRDEGVELNEIAVLYRAHYHAIELQLELSRRGIPYQITSGIRFFEQAHIKDVTAFIRFVANPRDEVAFKRMVKLAARHRRQKRGQSLARMGKVAWARARQRSHRWSDAAPRDVRRREVKKSWEQLAHTLDEIAPGGQPNPPSEMITSIVEAIYDDYAKANFTNYELREKISTSSPASRASSRTCTNFSRSSH